MPPSELATRMKELEKRAKVLLKTGEYDHLGVCTILADRYRLWDSKGMFPIWLSRVVQGVMEDRA